jgi:hypothetical protein
MRASDDIPPSLRTWFFVHFLVDVVLGIPLLIAPELVLPRLGFGVVDGVAPRLLGAALIAIGLQALRSRQADRATCRAFLALELVWSVAAMTGMIIAIGTGAPSVTWAILSAFVASTGVSGHYAIRLKQMDAGPAEETDLGGPLDTDPTAENDATTEDLGPIEPRA